MVNKHTISLRGHIERDILVRELGACAAILVPHIDRLPVLNEGTEALAQTVDFLAHAEIQLGEHVALFLGVDPVFVAMLVAALVCHVANRAEGVAGELLAAWGAEDEI